MAGKKGQCDTCKATMTIPMQSESEPLVQMKSDDADNLVPNSANAIIRRQPTPPAREKLRREAKTFIPRKWKPAIRKKLTPAVPGQLKPAEVIVGLVVALGAVVYMASNALNPSSNIGSNRGASAAPTSPSANDDMAIDGSLTLLYKNLKAPSTAELVSKKIIDRKPPWYIVHVVLDAQNSFGAQIRDSFLCCIKLLPNGKYAYDKNTAFSMVERDVSDEEIKYFKLLNQWDEK